MKDPAVLATTDMTLKVDGVDEEDASKEQLRPGSDKPAFTKKGDVIVVDIKLSDKDVEFKKVVLPVKENVDESLTKILAKSTTVDTLTPIEVSRSSVTLLRASCF